MAATLRNLLNRAIKEDIDKAGCQPCVNFSGGTDSCCILFSCLELGYKPRCYTYAVDGMGSPDLEKARMVTRHYGLELIECIIPADMTSLIADVRRLVARGLMGKVCLQCMHGHLYTAEAMGTRHEGLAMNGSGIDGLYGSYKQFAFDGSYKDKGIFDEHRRQHLINPNDDCMVDQARLYSEYGVQVAYPYRSDPVVQTVMGLDYYSINRPRRKWVIVREYPEFEQIAKLYRPRGSQQIMAGTRELHERLLRSPLNTCNRSRVIDIYKDVAEGRA